MPTIPAQEQKPAVTDREIVLECAHRLRVAIEAESENRSKALEALEFGNGKQWPDDLYNQRRISKRPSLTINHTNTFVRRVVNNMRQQRPRIKVHPVGEGANVEVADVITGLIRHVENRSNAAIAYDTGGESAVRMGWGYWRVLTEYVDEHSFDQEVCIEAIRNPFTVYMDPGAVRPAGEDAEWVIITEKMRRQEYARRYPDADNVMFRNTGSGDDLADWETREEIRLAEYYRIKRIKDTLYRMTNGMQMFGSDIAKLQDELSAAKVSYALDLRGNRIKRESYRQRVEWFRLNGQDIVDRRTVGDNPLPDKWIPVVRCEGNVLDLNGRVVRKGMIADLMDPARMLNYWKTCETEQIALSPKAPFIVADGQTDGHAEWKDANQVPYSALTYTPTYLENPDGSKIPVPPPTRMPAPQVPAAFVQAAQGAMQDLMAVSGMPHEPSNDTPGTVVSGIALQRRQALSDIGHFQYYDNQTRAIAHTGSIILSLIPHYYSTERMQRIIGEDGTPSMVAINQKQPSPENPAITKVKNDVTVGRYDVVMDTGPGYETKRLEGTEAMIDLMKTPLAEAIVKVGADLVVRNMDFAGASDLADRLMPMNDAGMKKALENMPKEARSMVTAMYQNMQALQQQLQQLELEKKYKGQIELGWMNVERDKINKQSETKVHDTEVRARTQMHDTHIDAITRRDVAEIQAAGKLMDTHVAKGYDLTQSEREMEHAAELAEKAPKGE